MPDDSIFDESGDPATEENPIIVPPVQEPERSSLSDAETSPPAGEEGEKSLPPLIRASDLLDPADEDTGDFEPGGLYKGFEMLPAHLWPADEWTPRHAERFPGRFYVQTAYGTPGLVPWPGSQIVWPWDRAWAVDLHRTEVTSFLKEEKEAKKK